MDDLSGGLDVCSSWIYGLEFPTGVSVGQQWIQICLKVPPLDFISIGQGKVLKQSFIHFDIPIERILNVILGSSPCVKQNRNETWTSLMNLTHCELMYLVKV